MDFQYTSITAVILVPGALRLSANAQHPAGHGELLRRKLPASWGALFVFSCTWLLRRACILVSCEISQCVLLLGCDVHLFVGRVVSAGYKNRHKTSKKRRSITMAGDDLPRPTSTGRNSSDNSRHVPVSYSLGEHVCAVCLSDERDLGCKGI